MKVEKSSSDLESEVIFRNMCAHCGTCGSCPHVEFDAEGPNAGIPNITDACNETIGLCYNSCPRTDFDTTALDKKMYGKIRENQNLGVFEQKMLVKAGKKGILNGLIETAFKNKMIDAMVVPKKTSKKPVNNMPEVVDNAKSVPELGGLNLNYTGPLVMGVNTAYIDGKKSVGLIGNPCHTQGGTKIFYSDFKSNITVLGLKIAVMCASGGAKGCIYCTDYAGEFADISYGEAGQEKGTAVLLARTEKGKKIIQLALKDKKFTKVNDEPNMEKIETLASKKKKRNIKNILKLNAAKLGYLNMTPDDLSYYFS